MRRAHRHNQQGVDHPEGARLNENEIRELLKLSRGEIDLSEIPWTVQRVAAPRRTSCLYCDTPLVQTSKRPRIICGSRPCERKRSAAQKRKEYKKSLHRTYHEGNGERYTQARGPIRSLPPAEAGLKKVVGESKKHSPKHNPVTVRYRNRP